MKAKRQHVYITANARLMRSLGFTQSPKPVWYGKSGEFTEWTHPMDIMMTTHRHTAITAAFVVVQSIHTARYNMRHAAQEAAKAIDHKLATITGTSEDVAHRLAKEQGQ
jgi:hypothetical protein